MKRTLVAGLIMGATGVAMAQQAAPPVPPDPVLNNLGQDQLAANVSRRHLFEDIEALVGAYVALRNENTKLRADLAKAGTPPPATPAPTPPNPN